MNDKALDEIATVYEKKKKKRGTIFDDDNFLAEYIPLCVKMRKIVNKIGKKLPTPAFDADLAAKCYEGHEPYLGKNPLPIDCNEFRKGIKEFAELLVEKDMLGFEDLPEARWFDKLDWNKISDKTIKYVGKDPAGAVDRILSDLGESCLDYSKMANMLWLIFSFMNAYLQGVGEDMTEFLRQGDLYKKIGTNDYCPTCGGHANLAVIRKGKEDDQYKELYCQICGTRWPFEKDRCANCLNDNPDDYDYAFKKKDPAHRLYECSKCGASFGTVFEKYLEAPLDYDIAKTVCTTLDFDGDPLQDALEEVYGKRLTKPPKVVRLKGKAMYK